MNREDRYLLAIAELLADIRDRLPAPATSGAGVVGLTEPATPPPATDTAPLREPDAPAPKPTAKKTTPPKKAGRRPGRT